MFQWFLEWFCPRGRYDEGQEQAAGQKVGAESGTPSVQTQVVWQQKFAASAFTAANAPPADGGGSTGHPAAHARDGAREADGDRVLLQDNTAKPEEEVLERPPGHHRHYPRSVSLEFSSDPYDQKGLGKVRKGPHLRRHEKEERRWEKAGVEEEELQSISEINFPWLELDVHRCAAELLPGDKGQELLGPENVPQHHEDQLRGRGFETWDAKNGVSGPKVCLGARPGGIHPAETRAVPARPRTLGRVPKETNTSSNEEGEEESEGLPESEGEAEGGGGQGSKRGTPDAVRISRRPAGLRTMGRRPQRCLLP